MAEQVRISPPCNVAQTQFAHQRRQHRRQYRMTHVGAKHGGEEYPGAFHRGLNSQVTMAAEHGAYHRFFSSAALGPFAAIGLQGGDSNRGLHRPGTRKPGKPRLPVLTVWKNSCPTGREVQRVSAALTPNPFPLSRGSPSQWERGFICRVRTRISCLVNRFALATLPLSRWERGPGGEGRRTATQIACCKWETGFGMRLSHLAGFRRHHPKPFPAQSREPFPVGEGLYLPCSHKNFMSRESFRPCNSPPLPAGEGAGG